MAIVNFRYVPAGWLDSQIDTVNKKIAQRSLQDGYATVLTTVLDGQTVLRVCAIHPDATEDDMQQTICKLNEFALSESALVNE